MVRSPQSVFYTDRNENMIDRTDIWSILHDRLPIDDMLADRFYAYLHDSEQKKMKHLQPMKKLILKQTARHKRWHLNRYYTIHQGTVKRRDVNLKLSTRGETEILVSLGTDFLWKIDVVYSCWNIFCVNGDTWSDIRQYIREQWNVGMSM